MAIEAADLVKVAQHLLDPANHQPASEEAQIRTAVNRSYYAVYHALCKWEQKHLPIPGAGKPNAGVHEQFVHRLKNPDRSVVGELRARSVKFGQRLGGFKLQRHEADYELGSAFHPAMARQNCTNMQLMVQEINQA